MNSPTIDSVSPVSRYVRSALARVAGGLSLTCAVAVAQTGSPPGGDDQSVGLQEVTVTAQRRAQSIQDIPYNISAVNSDLLRQAGASNIGDLAALVPGLAYVDTGAGSRGNANNFTLRGIRTDAAGSANEDIPSGSVNAVSTYYGETPVFFPIPLHDLERVEVLRGPQGTLYGSGSLAGTIRFIPNKPNFDKLSGSLEVSGGLTQNSHSDPNSSVDGVLNIPLLSNLAVRVSAGYERLAGFIDDVNLVQRTGPGGVLAAPTPAIPGDLSSGFVLAPVKNATNASAQSYEHLAVRWKPADTVEMTVDYLHQNSHVDDAQISNPNYRGGVFDPTCCTDPTTAPVPPPFTGANVTTTLRGGGRYDNTEFSQQPYGDTVNLISAVFNVDLGRATLTSATSYFDNRSWSVVDNTAVYFIPGPGGTMVNNYFPVYSFYPRLDAVLPTTVSDRTFTQEVRLASEGQNFLDYVLGAYYSRDTQPLSNVSTIPGISAYAQLPEVQAYNAGYGIVGANPFGDSTDLYQRDTEFYDRAVFGELTFHVTPHWQLTGGVRFFDQDFRIHFSTASPYCGPICAGDGTNPEGLTAVSQSSHIRDHVSKFNTSYELTDDLRIYATYSEGFRRGGANPLPTSGYFASLPQYETFRPDYSKNFEVGLKGNLLNRRLRYTADVFLINLSDFQFDASALSGFRAVFNGSHARSKGVEMQLEAAVSQRLQTTLGYTYTDAAATQSTVITDLEPYTATPAVSVSIPEGARLPGVPRHSVTATADYTIPLQEFAAGWSMRLHVDGSYRSSEWASIDQSSVYFWVIPATFQGNGRVTFEDSKNWAVDFFVNNFTNALGLSGGYGSQTVEDPFAARHPARPRTFGGRIRYSFN